MATNLLKVMVYMTPELKESLEQLGKKENRSLSNLIVTILQKKVTELENESPSAEQRIV